MGTIPAIATTEPAIARSRRTVRAKHSDSGTESACARLRLRLQTGRHICRGRLVPIPTGAPQVRTAAARTGPTRPFTAARAAAGALPRGLRDNRRVDCI